ncbi:TlpA family protein disulfide reductase [Hymenobacter busanensis]|uniref:TlpA family protein disulfide reductase n=1 Tax=Hymenobacter busanensis TaxID=2607656 RepID=A0A7L4ZWW4_9BACT|nr:TlpA disulfide reductase family protein [Hymenobacter busanensis]KAA9333337.1 TlpA family protein disulfide reductase [Hymenobacter busanensis]QHJ07984.1 redoxin family protein [Hymenobacter busanensis]
MVTVFQKLLLPFVAAALLAPAATYAQGTVVLTGKINGKTADSVAVSVREHALDPKEQLTYARVNDKGEFRLAMKVDGPTKADLVYADDVAALWLEPGAQMDVRFKGEDLAGTVKFKGKGAEANTYLAEFDEKFVENDGLQVLPENINLYEPGFLSFLDYRRKEERKFLQDVLEDQNVSAQFRQYVQAEVDYSYANDRLTFQDLREQVVATEGRLKMSPTYYDFLNEPSLVNNPAAIQNENYQEFLLNYVHYLAAAGGHKKLDPDYYQVCYNLAKEKLSGDAKPIIMGRVLQETFRFGHVRQSSALLEDFHTRIDTKNKYYPVLKADFDAHKDFAIGSPAPDFKLVSTTGDTVTLRSFAGKLVYVNFWRTTSGLALRDLPYAQELAKKFKGDNIVFLNIALDENEPAWKQLVISKKLAGVHVRATGGQRGPLAKSYMLQEVPAYFLIAEDGTFLNTKPKRLSSRAAVDEIKESFGKAATYTSVLRSEGKN